MGYIPDDESDDSDDSSDNSTMTPDELEDEFELLRRLPSTVDWRRRGVVTPVKDQVCTFIDYDVSCLHYDTK